MPARSKVLRLPRETRAELDARLVEMGFAGYDELVEWLRGLGHDLSRDSLWRYGKGVKDELDEELRAIRIATAEAQALKEVLEEEGGGSVKSEAALGLVQERMFRALRDLKEGASIDDVAKAARAVNQTAAAQVAVSRERREGRREAAEEAVRVGRRHGLSRKGEAAIRAQVEGLGR